MTKIKLQSPYISKHLRGFISGSVRVALQLPSLSCRRENGGFVSQYINASLSSFSAMMSASPTTMYGLRYIQHLRPPAAEQRWFAAGITHV